MLFSDSEVTGINLGLKVIRWRFFPSLTEFTMRSVSGVRYEMLYPPWSFLRKKKSKISTLIRICSKR